MSLTIFVKSSISDVWQSFKHHFDFHSDLMEMEPELVQLLLETVFWFQIVSRENFKDSLGGIVKRIDAPANKFHGTLDRIFMTTCWTIEKL